MAKTNQKGTLDKLVSAMKLLICSVCFVLFLWWWEAPNPST